MAVFWGQVWPRYTKPFRGSGLFAGPDISTMASNVTAGFLRLNSVDQHGRRIDPMVLAAAEEVLPRALEHSAKMSYDPAIAANVLEEVAADTSHRLEQKDGSGILDPIRNLPRYVFHAFALRLNRLKRKEPALVRGNGMGQALASKRADPWVQLETKVLVDECLAQCGPSTQEMFWQRAQGLTWKEIGKIHGLSGHAAEVRFRQAIRDVQSRLKK